MANIGAVKSDLGGWPVDQRLSLTRIFTYVLGNLRAGLPGHQKRAENFQWIQLNSTTPATANQEFAVAHGIGTSPRVLFPCLDLTSSGGQCIPLQTSRAADNNYLYLKSTSTSAAFVVFVESR